MITGCIVALVTPMHPDGSIDWDNLGRLVDWHIDMGTNGIVPVGTTGESATVTVDEHCQLIERVVSMVAGKIPVIAGTGGNATAEAIALTSAARDAGADACLLVTPYYNKPTQEGLIQHYEAIAASVNLPQILYNVPGRTACDMLPGTIARLADLAQVIGIKEATGSLERSQEIRSLCGDKIMIYSGDDATACDLMLQGAQGAISVTANLVPDKMATMCALAVSGDEVAAKSIDTELQGLHSSLFQETNPIPVKWALAQMGRIESGIRLPLTPLSDVCHHSLLKAMHQAGIEVGSQPGE